MMNHQTNKTSNKKRQLILIVVVIVISVLLALLLLLKKQKPTVAGDADQPQVVESPVKAKSSHVIELSKEQVVAQQIKLDHVKTGSVKQQTQIAGRLVVNTDQQAHVSPNFSGMVEAVYVHNGQQVKKGQALASLLVPELVNMQASMQTLASKQALALTEYQREKALWQQGISAKQDYLQAESQYQQAHIEYQAAQSRLNAYGASGSGAGRFTVTAPISGVIQNKAVVTGESVQLAQQLFLIDQLDQLWLEFTVPVQLVDQLAKQVSQHKSLNFVVSSTGQQFTAILQSLIPSADAQTGRLVARAVVNNLKVQLRPNMLVNVIIEQQTDPQDKLVLVQRAALQQVNNQPVVFVVESTQTGMRFKPQPVVVDESSSTAETAVIQQGLKDGQQYVSVGSFILKSELEKEASDD